MRWQVQPLPAFSFPVQWAENIPAHHSGNMKNIRRIKMASIPYWMDMAEPSQVVMVQDNRLEWAAKFRRIQLEKSRAESLEKQKGNTLLAKILATPL
jgi:hypothetical protein